MKTIIQEFICNPEEYKSFDEVAIQLFRYLYQNNLAYQQYCRKKGSVLSKLDIGRTFQVYRQRHLSPAF